jgi:hypothetical protein
MGSVLMMRESVHRKVLVEQSTSGNGPGCVKTQKRIVA